MKGFSGWKFSNYPGFFRGSLFLLMFAVAPLAGRCQLSHLDSLLAIDLGGAISQQFGNKPFTLTGEGSLQPLILAIPHSVGTSTIAQISGISGKVGARDLRGEGDSGTVTVLVKAQGMVITPGNSLSQAWGISRSFDISLTARDRILLETNHDRYVSLEQPVPPSFWADTLEPVLVVLGGLVIIALFFLIRS